MPTTETTRTFLGLALPEATVERLARRVESTLAPEAPGIRWASRASLHLTLAFLGDVANERLGSLAEGVASACARLSPCALEVVGLGAFPDARRPRVVWAGVEGEDLPRLVELQRAVARAVREAGCPPSDDRFSPHVTLGRVERTARRPPDLTDLVRESAGWVAGPLPVAEVILYASDLRPRGPVYTPLARAPLQGGKDPSP